MTTARRITAAAAAAAALLLTGCGGDRDLDDARLMARAMDAYRAADRQALADIRAEFDGLHPPEDADQDLEACAPEHWPIRRGVFFREMIKRLDQPTVFSMSEEARQIYFDAVMLLTPVVDAPDFDPRVCDGSVPFRVNRILDERERAATLAAYVKRAKAWRRDLELKHGDNFEAREHQAEEVLVANHILPPQFVLAHRQRR